MILSRRLLLTCPILSYSSQHSPRSMSAPEVDFGQPLIVSLWKSQRNIADCTLASAAIGPRSLCKHHRAGWHAPGRHMVGETSMMVGRASNASTRGIHQAMSKLDRRYDSQEADGGQCSGSRVRYYLHPAIDYHDRLTPAIGHANSIAWHKPARGYLLSTIYPCVRPEHYLNRRRCNHATTCAARSRAFPIDMLMIALSVGS